MADPHQPGKTSLNARTGALALAVCGPMNLVLHLQGASLAPLSFAFWLGLSFGVLCFCEEMGAGRPLNRAGLVLFAAAFCANVAALLAVDPNVVVRASLLYAFTTLGALVFWSVALMHRRRSARAVGAIGAIAGGGALALLIAAHLMVGAATILGFSQLFAALQDARHASFAALAVIDSLLCIWCLSIAGLLWTTRLDG